MAHVTSPTSLAVDVPQGRKLFVFDRVFPETVDQEGIWDYLSDSVGSFLQGYNVSILAYGQSGAGKSYTMGTSGPNEQGDTQAMGESDSFFFHSMRILISAGIIPRAAQLLFEKLEGPKHSRTSSTGLRTPARYSISSTSSFGKQNVEKNWQLKATYVEV
jgi:kinesin family protein 4/21/27